MLTRMLFFGLSQIPLISQFCARGGSATRCHCGRRAPCGPTSEFGTSVTRERRGTLLAACRERCGYHVSGVVTGISHCFPVHPATVMVVIEFITWHGSFLAFGILTDDINCVAWVFFCVVYLLNEQKLTSKTNGPSYPVIAMTLPSNR